MKKALPILLCLAALQGFGQSLNYDTAIAGASGSAWNMTIHLPPTYYNNTIDSFQAIIFFVGLGQVGTDSSQVAVYGPTAYLRSGWNGGVVLGNGTHYPIIISIQPPAAWARPYDVKFKIDAILSRYRIKRDCLHMTGLSMGGWESTQFVAYQPTAGDLTYGRMVRSVVDVEGVKPDDTYDATPAYPDKFVPWAEIGGKFWGFEQCNDFRDINTIVTTMDSAVTGSATYQPTCYGDGSHGFWENEYGPDTNAPKSYVNGGVSQTIYQWMLRQGDTVSTLHPSGTPPTVTADSTQTITLPTDSVTLTGTASGNGGATISSTSWTKASGGSATITSPSSLTTKVTGLTAGTYVFQLTATDNHSLSASAYDTVVVNSGGSSGGTAINYDTTFSLSGTTFNTIVHLPANYYSNSTDSFPGILYFTDGPESGSDSSLVGVHGPAAYIRGGWDGSVVLGSVTHYPIIISVQTPSAFARPATMKPVLDAILGRYRIKRNSLHITGITDGGWVATQFVAYQQAAGDYTYGRMIRSVTDVEGVKPDDSLSYGGTYPQKFESYATVGGKLLGLEQCESDRDIATIVNTMNATVSGSAYFVGTCFGDGTGGYSQYFYGDDTTTPSNFSIGGVSENIYQWMLRQGDTANDYQTSAQPRKVATDAGLAVDLSAAGLTIYPNPASDRLTIQWSSDYSGNLAIRLYDADGRMVRNIASRKDGQDYNGEVVVNGLAPGVYILEIKLETGKVIIQKVVKR